MAPFGALGPILGTNPLAIASPAGSGKPPPSLDVATSVVAQGRIILAQRAGTEIPADWAIGPDGKPTQDPNQALAGAVLSMAGHKGFGLAFMLDVLSGCRPGAQLSQEITQDPNAPDPKRPAIVSLPFAKPASVAAKARNASSASHWRAGAPGHLSGRAGREGP